MGYDGEHKEDGGHHRSKRDERGGGAAHHLQDEVGPPLALEVGPTLAPPREVRKTKGLPSPFGHNGSQSKKEQRVERRVQACVACRHAFASGACFAKCDVKRAVQNEMRLSDML